MRFSGRERNGFNPISIKKIGALLRKCARKSLFVSASNNSKYSIRHNLRKLETVNFLMDGFSDIVTMLLKKV